MRAIVPTVLIMIGCIMLGSGLYLGRVVKYENEVKIADFVRSGNDYYIYTNSSTGSIWFYVYKGQLAPDERKEAIVFTEIPNPENIKLYNIENVVITLDISRAVIYIPNRDATTEDWADVEMSIGKLENPEDYLNPDLNMWNFNNMNVIGQYDTAEHKISNPYTNSNWVYVDLSGASYKFRYNNEKMLGIGLVPISTLWYPPYGWWAIDGYIGLQFEGKGLVKLYGYVVSENGNPIDKVCISCDYGVVYTDENGYYEINVPPESMKVNYSKEGYENKVMTIDVPDRDNYRVDVILKEYSPTIDKSKVLIMGGLGMILIGLVSLMVMLTQKVKMEMRV